MFRGMEKQTINSMVLEINEENRIEQWFIEETEIPRDVYSKLTLKSILKEEYFDQVSNLIVKSIIYGRSAVTNIIAGKGIKRQEYELLIIPKNEHMIIDIKRMT